ncbi:YeeE/YedE family protein [Candidatus Bathyarchaeota archaeon]|nr:MAG: YeeE/YedE family protein [Candidatus Bathyarchaeota archaeon]
MSDKERVFRNLAPGVAAFTVAFFISIYYTGLSSSLAIFWLFGLAYGIVIQRSKFCFASAFRDLFLFKRGELMKAIIAGLIIATVGFSIIMYATVGLAKPIDSIKDGIPAHAKVNPVGLQTIIGGIVFGFGMVLSGGCATGTLWRAGEGYSVQWVALIGFILGTIPLAFMWEPIYDGYVSHLPKIWFPEVFGWGGAILLTLFLLGFAYLLVSWWESKAEFKFSHVIERKSKNPKKIIPILKEKYGNIFYQPWPYLVGGLLLGTLNAFEYVFSKPWGVTTAISRWGGWLLLKTGIMHTSNLWPYYTQYKLVENPSLTSGSTLLNLGLIFGAFAMAILAGEFKVRIPTKKIRFAQGFVGGFFMGFGSRLAMGCNIGAFFTAVPSLALAGWVFGPGLAIGAWLGVKALKKLA